MLLEMEGEREEEGVDLGCLGFVAHLTDSQQLIIIIKN